MRDKASIFTAEQEAIVSALRYIKSTTNRDYYEIFLVFLHTVQKTIIFCWLPSHVGITGNERADCFI